MTTWRIIAEDMRDSVNGARVMNQSQFARYVGKRSDKITDILSGLHWFSVNGKDKTYLITDLAKALANRQQAPNQVRKNVNQGCH